MKKLWPDSPELRELHQFLNDEFEELEIEIEADLRARKALVPSQGPLKASGRSAKALRKTKQGLPKGFG